MQAIVDAVAPNVDWQTVGRSKDYPAFGPRKGRAAVRDRLGAVFTDRGGTAIRIHEHTDTARFAEGHRA